MKKFENGVKAVEFTAAQTKALLSRDADEQKRALTYTAQLLPAKYACQVIKTVIMSSPGNMRALAPVSNMLDIMAEQHKDVPDCQHGDVYARQDEVRKAFTVAPPIKSGADPRSPKLAEDACRSERPDKTPANLVAYYEILRPEDHDIASRIAFRIPSAFPSAGIDVVALPPGAPEEADVRYFDPAQKPNAEWLGCMLTAAYKAETHAEVPGPTHRFEPRLTDPRFRHVPTNRMEVWFPRIER